MQSRKDLFYEILRFLIAGGTATAADYAVAYLFYRFLLPPSLTGQGASLIISTALGFLTGLIINWILSVAFVYRQVRDEKKARSKKSFFVFALIGLVGLFLTEIIVRAGVPLLPDIYIFGSPTFLSAEWKWWICKVTATLVVLVFNYILRKTLIFRS